MSPAAGRGSDPVMVTEGWSAASPYILRAGLDVLAVGGFSGHVPTPEWSRLQELLSSGRVVPVLLGTATKATRPGDPAARLRDWVTGHCRFVPPARYEGPGRHLSGEDLYLCSPPGTGLT